MTVVVNRSKFRVSMLSWLLKLLISVLLLIFIFRQVNLTVFFQTLRDLQVGFLSISILLFFPAQVLAAFRWWYVLCQIGCDQPFWHVFRLNLLGQFSALFLPGQISGDVVRAIGMARGAKYSERVAFSVIVDKLAFLAPIATFSTLGFLLKNRLSSFIGIYILSGCLVIIALEGLIGFGRYRSRRVELLMLNWADHLPSKIRDFIKKSIDFSLSRLSYQAIAFTVLLGYGMQIFNFAGSYMMARAMDINVPVFDWAVIQAMVSIVQVFPISLGGLGIREGTFVLILSLYALSSSQIMAFSLTGFLITAILIILCWLASEAMSTFYKVT